MRSGLLTVVYLVVGVIVAARRAHKPDQASGREPVAAWRGVSKGFLT
ncbi:MAG TPA: hypothetical protein VFE45_09950 [Coriobacteriia bacterium]|jgi:hypothetical protein|nr:hypothetical protein [Coriobacteriia bacterium]